MFFFNKYYKTIGRNIFYSKYLFSEFSSFFKIDIDTLSIENSLGLKSHFIYLLLLSKRTPFIKKNIIIKKVWNSSNKKVIKIIAFPHKARLSRISHIFLNSLIPFQIPAENPVIYITRKNIKIVAWNAPLSKETFCVQLNENSFIRDIPISFTFNFKQGTLVQKIFFSIFFGFLKYSEEDWNNLSIAEFN